LATARDVAKDAWGHTQRILDVAPGRGGMFSLEKGTERRFLTRSRAFSGDEVCSLAGPVR